jgi:ubiquinone/menaquinone biosynthesis C-methylase UbiE
MPRLSEPDYLAIQYKTADNLDARRDLHARFSTEQLSWLQWVFDQIEMPSDGSLLEAGCGTGALWSENGGRIPPGWQITLSDMSPGMLEKTSSDLAPISRSRDITYKTINIQDIPEPDESFDAAIANHMLYHVPDRQRAISELHRVLKPGGLLLAATNGANHMIELAKLVQQFDPSYMNVRGAESFGLENGAEQLSELFSEVECLPFDSSLLVTEVEPIVAYVLSSDLPLLKNNKREAFITEVKRVIEVGPFHVTKNPGLFCARKST